MRCAQCGQTVDDDLVAAVGRLERVGLSVGLRACRRCAGVPAGQMEAEAVATSAFLERLTCEQEPSKRMGTLLSVAGSAMFRASLLATELGDAEVAAGLRLLIEIATDPARVRGLRVEGQR